MAAFPLPPLGVPLVTALDAPLAVDQAVEKVVELTGLLEDPSAQEPQLVGAEDELVLGSHDPQLVVEEVELVLGSHDPQVVVEEPGCVGKTVTVV